MPSASFPSNGSFVAHYAKESSKQLAVGIVNLGDMGYKKLSRYCSELLPDGNTSLQSGNPGWKGNGTVIVSSTDAENVGMVHAFLKFSFTCFWNHTYMPAPFFSYALLL
jgi:hypothetical protein